MLEPFTDTDLRRLKESLYPQDGTEINYVDSFVSGDSCRSLLARLEAAEALITDECDCEDLGHADACSQYQAWRVSKGD